jgi:hypothetical protein
LNPPFWDGRTPPMIAAIRGRVNIVADLVKASLKRDFAGRNRTLEALT